MVKSGADLITDVVKVIVQGIAASNYCNFTYSLVSV